MVSLENPCNEDGVSEMISFGCGLGSMVSCVR